MNVINEDFDADLITLAVSILLLNDCSLWVLSFFGIIQELKPQCICLAVAMWSWISFLSPVCYICAMYIKEHKFIVSGWIVPIFRSFKTQSCTSVCIISMTESLYLRYMKHCVSMIIIIICMCCRDVLKLFGIKFNCWLWMELSAHVPTSRLCSVYRYVIWPWVTFLVISFTATHG